MVAKRFFYVCAGLLCLALVYHLGAQSATAQTPGNPVVASFPSGGVIGNFAAVTAGGDVYFFASLVSPWSHVSNIFSGPTPVT